MKSGKSIGLKPVAAGLLLSALIGPGSVAAENSNAELAKASQNPVANLISLPLQNNTDFNVGPENETKNTLNIQPVLPFSL